MKGHGACNYSSSRSYVAVIGGSEILCEEINAIKIEVGEHS